MGKYTMLTSFMATETMVYTNSTQKMALQVQPELLRVHQIFMPHYIHLVFLLR